MENNFNYGLWYKKKVLEGEKLKLVELEKQKRFIEFDIIRCKEEIERFEKLVKEDKEK